MSTQEEAKAATNLTDDEIEEGCLWQCEVDPEDNRWLIYTFRMVNMAKLAECVLHRGVDAQHMTMRYFLASAGGVLDTLNRSIPIAIAESLQLPAMVENMRLVHHFVKTNDEARKAKRDEPKRKLDS